MALAWGRSYLADVRRQGYRIGQDRAERADRMASDERVRREWAVTGTQELMAAEHKRRQENAAAIRAAR